jgi:pyroglutamyl-peptidase
MNRVLVTGFEPNDDGINASEVVVQALTSQLSTELKTHRAELFFQVFPGDTNKLQEAVEDCLISVEPDVCIGIGQARGYNKIAIERMAKNLRYFVTPDRAGNTPQGVPVVEDAVIAYWHSLHDIEGTVRTLRDNGIPARVMNDCGTHLCNQAFYHCLHWSENHRPSMQVGFVHIPALPKQVIEQWPEAPFMPLEMTCRAIALIVDNQL